MITCLAGGVGAARLLEGLDKIVEEHDQELTVVVNTGDDEEFFGLHISPDIDIITYTLAGIVEPERGWGIRGDTFACLDMLEKLGCETWFKLGDRDMAIHIYRTWKLRDGATLSQVTAEIAAKLGARHKIIPMSDDPVKTHIKTPTGLLPFQRYFVEREARDEVLDVVYVGADRARPAPGVIDSIIGAEGVIICPSNPIVSIGTILAVPGVREALRKTPGKVLAVSPIIGGATVKGPADKMMRGLGIEVSAAGVAKLYKDFLDIYVMDEQDAELREKVQSMGVEVHITNTLMRSLEDKKRLAKTCLELLGL
ncbi:MAG: 2-phospho-L-lactate transferase [Aigarchaeota archaeon]|nr:2-phospho-L-lactate transferase [Candidatus Pelearchaeum maunauluense]